MPEQPVRTCVGCRRREPQDLLLRVVAAEGSVAVDARRRLPGRGAYVHPVPACVATAVKRRAFGRALRTTVDAGAAGVVLTAHLEGAAPAALGSGAVTG